MIALDPNLIDDYKKVLESYHYFLRKPILQNEIDYIERTVSYFSKIRLPSSTQLLVTRSAKIHKKPLTHFPPCTPAIARQGQDKEIADILLIYKHFTNGNLDAYRGSLIQAKFTRDSKQLRWKDIDSAQFCLLTSWPTFTIVSPLHFFKAYTLIPKTRSWSTYGLVAPNVLEQPIFYSADRILDQLGSFPKGADFTFNAQPLIFDVSQSFFMKFIKERFGENLLVNPSIAGLVIDLYKIAGLEPDPPEEFEEVSENKIMKGPFGIIEITIRAENRR